ncbi:hypothetical protein WOLCODRAFT_140038 [Wolfiporia cocos MD-104 SS10]|uniref:Uncharacterized protein n=1 Tax=Wolfiporia cocos (strain MD-104) TaxID=742152 RepID=A0A2H3JDE5_WOLCO|nr:hypothetical protein WOLCODRAFT_140038 [Wolfiporia cocos MD-104 SS10]
MSGLCLTHRATPSASDTNLSRSLSPYHYSSTTAPTPISMSEMDLAGVYDDVSIDSYGLPPPYHHPYPPSPEYSAGTLVRPTYVQDEAMLAISESELESHFDMDDDDDNDEGTVSTGDNDDDEDDHDVDDEDNDADDEDDTTLHDTPTDGSSLRIAVQNAFCGDSPSSAHSRLNTDYSLSRLSSLFDVSCLEALDDQLLASPTDSFAEVCYAQSISANAAGRAVPCPPRSAARPPVRAQTPPLEDAHATPPDGAEEAEWHPTHVAADSWQTLAVPVDTEASAWYAKSVSESDHSCDLAADVEFVFQSPPLLSRNHTLVRPNRRCEDGRCADEPEGGKHVHFGDLSAAKDHCEELCCERAMELPYLFSRTTPDPAQSVHFFPTWVEDPVKKPRGVLRVVMRNITGIFR